MDIITLGVGTSNADIATLTLFGLSPPAGGGGTPDSGSNVFAITGISGLSSGGDCPGVENEPS